MAQQDDEKRQGTIQREEDCVECKIFGQGICLRAFQEFDKCFEDASAQGLGDDVCMDKFDAFRSCYAQATSAQARLRISMK
ncbi:hypothetical protein DUNSADRAFT_18095 [Dunaliella salina]|uniref:Uncharacterized protein n=1 Tax=Dunaliella salina TaxID=3046 RepID=A0ABQ7G0Q1_DUNSA|nr:hypothetical protein DUNSADRAFT_18095 [Dunaliella salina]|eukprot:KAF5828172.1 hypothetical protein DUNSADRAFT_18095 [Dunaliella salina]